MRKIIRQLFSFSFIIMAACCFGQREQFTFKRELKGISEPWHKIVLPDDVFEKISPDFADIRILGVGKTGKQVEAPYLIRIASAKVSGKEIAFTTINKSFDEKGYFFTFELPTSQAVNQVLLNFKETNFDWRVNLEGSQDQRDWFTLLENYRIVSIQNLLTNFQFTRLTFPDASYKYLRLRIDSKAQPELMKTSITVEEKTEGSFREYNIKKWEVRENREKKQTEIEVELDIPVPVSYFNIEVSDKFDYYRPFTIEYLADSTQTEKGWLHMYNALVSGMLSSVGENEFSCSSTVAKKFRIYLQNHDNQPLQISSLQVKGYVHELIARFTEPGTYFLIYGSKEAGLPNYDIARFSESIPDSLTPLTLGRELLIEKEQVPVKEPLFKNKIWLWVVMVLIILVLGWFSVNMIKNKQ